MLSPIYFSETLFLSRSANAEIDYICGADGVRKNYFCVNLSDSQPKGILRKIMLMDEQLLDVAGLDMDRIGTLARAFSDKQTFLYYKEIEHTTKLLEQIRVQFDVIELIKKNYALLDVETNEPVMITGETFVIGSEKRKCHLFIDNLRVSRVHATIAVKGGDTYIMDMGSKTSCYIFLYMLKYKKRHICRFLLNTKEG